MRTRHQWAVPVFCAVTFGMASTACAMGDKSTDTARGDTRSQQEIGRQIVTDTKRHSSQPPSHTMDQQQSISTEEHQRVSQQMAAGSNAMGVPEPGSVSDQESTAKQRRPDSQHRSDQNAQVTLGGSKYFVYGEVLRIEGDNYFLRDQESGDEVRLIVNRDTNLDCGATPTAGGTMSTEREQQPAEATERQRAQGQRANETAAGSGFTAGDCSFNQGDKVKAEVSDVGTVTTLKFMPKEQGSGKASATTQMQGTNPENVSEDASRDRSPSAEQLKKQTEGKEAPAELRQ
jgi:hypothetical protein